MIRLYLIIFISMLCGSLNAAQTLLSPAPQAIRITTLDNINLAEVNKVIRSKLGYIWIATAEGLIRFDGYNAKHFQHDGQNSNSLSHNTVMDVIEDNQQNLWITTYGGGLNKFTPQTGRFEKIDLRTSADDTAALEQLYFLSIDDHNQLWIGSTAGLLRFDLTSEKAKPLPQVMATLPKDTTNGAFIDSKKNLWMGTFYHGLYRYQPATQDGAAKLDHFIHDANDITTVSNNNIRSAGEDELGTVWIGTTYGLNRYDRDKNNFQRFTPSQNNSEIIQLQDDITAIQSDHQGYLWLGTMVGGTLRFSLRDEQFIPVSGKRDLLKQFSARRVNAILRDLDNNLWFSTSDGVTLVTEKAQKIKSLSNDSATFRVTDISPLKSGEIALVGPSQYYQYDQLCHCAKPQLTNLTHPNRIAQDAQGNLWFSSFGNGLRQITPDPQGKLNQINDNSDHIDIPNDRLSDIFIDTQNRIWIAPFLDLPDSIGGLFRFNKKERRFETYIDKPWFTDVLQIDENNLLMTTDLVGPVSLHIPTKKVTHWHTNIPSAPLRAWQIFKDNTDSLWFATRGQGLAKFDRERNAFTFYTTEDGLLSNDILSIVQDNDYNLWLGTSIGLSRFNPHSKQVMNLEKQDGLMFSKFSRRVAYKTNSGKILLGTNKGLVVLNPADFTTQSKMPTVVINDFRTFNQSVEPATKTQPSPLKKAIEFTDKVVLSHQDYVFSFGFAALEYIRPDKIQFAYKMEGLDDNWVYTDASNRHASYTTLDDDEYIFRVKATNADGQWSDQETRITVVILPPWWHTWQAYVFYFVLSAGSIYLYIRLHTAKLHQQAKVLEQSVTKRTSELQHSNLQLEQSHQELADKSKAVSDLLAQKQRLFASVSHEFRTPLTLILSPIDQLLTSDKGKAIHKELNLIKRSGRRLLRMVDQLLEFAKLEQHTNTTSELVSLTQTVNIITASFEALVASKQITLTVSPFADVTLNLLPDSLNKILINIISNAFKYTQAKGQINLSVTTAADVVNILIKDNGIGIIEADQHVIFERFNRAGHANDESVSGAGIGLALVKELVEANKGQITLQSALNQGSTFTVSLPVAIGDQQSQSSDEHQVLAERLDLEIDSIMTQPATIDNQHVSEAADNDHHQKSILLIDDNADMRQLLNDQLSNSYRCFQAANGQTGLSTAREQLPDLIISDVMMPVMDGYELAQALKADELTSHIPIILLTAKGSTQSRIKGLQLLIDDYLAKPFNVEELTLRIHNILTIRDIVRKRAGQAIDTFHQGKGEHLGLNPVEQGFLTRVNQQLAEHYADIEFNATSLSEQLSLSERQLQRKIKALFDVSIPEMVRNYRLNKAIERLNGGQRASQVYFSVGFSSHSYFSSCFKAKFGQTPSEYQKAQ
ncbi:MAG: response regulator [Algicola sp.]|nr:response regulator [Algicola sp.]